MSEVGKLAGIKIKYEFICFPYSKVLLINIDVSNSLIKGYVEKVSILLLYMHVPAVEGLPMQS